MRFYAPHQESPEHGSVILQCLGAGNETQIRDPNLGKVSLPPLGAQIVML